MFINILDYALNINYIRYIQKITYSDDKSGIVYGLSFKTTDGKSYYKWYNNEKERNDEYNKLIK